MTVIDCLGRPCPMPVIELSSISKHYEMGQQRIKAVDALDLTIDYNEYIVFIGSSAMNLSAAARSSSCMKNEVPSVSRPSSETKCP